MQSFFLVKSKESSTTELPLGSSEPRAVPAITIFWLTFFPAVTLGAVVVFLLTFFPAVALGTFLDGMVAG